MRNNNTRMLNALGLDTGFDSIAEDNSTKLLSRLLDRLDAEGALPKMILFNLNPKMNTELMTLLGCFQSDEAKGKIQFGPAWWFLDNKVGMEQQLISLGNLGILGNFIGMLTDSRSFLSYTRHEYFRRILCNLIGAWVEDGEYPADMKTLEKIVAGICYYNAKNYFNF